MKRVFFLMGLCAALSGRAQGVLETELGAPFGPGTMAGGRFWMRVQNNEVEFIAALFGPFDQASSLAPVLEVPVVSLAFSLGPGAATVFAGLHWDRNPFLPAAPLPVQCDDSGFPCLLIDAPAFIAGSIYAGRFALPSGFESALLSGQGSLRIQAAGLPQSPGVIFDLGLVDPILSGSLAVVAVPEPSTVFLLAAGLAAMLLLKWRHPWAHLDTAPGARSSGRFKVRMATAKPLPVGVSAVKRRKRRAPTGLASGAVSRCAQHP